MSSCCLILNFLYNVSLTIFLHLVRVLSVLVITASCYPLCICKLYWVIIKFIWGFKYIAFLAILYLLIIVMIMCCLSEFKLDAVVVVIVWYLHLQLPIQLFHITIKVVSSNPVHGEVYSIQHYVIRVLSVTCDSSVAFSGFHHQ